MRRMTVSVAAALCLPLIAAASAREETLPEGVRMYDFPEWRVTAIQDQPAKMPGTLFHDSSAGGPVSLKPFYASSHNVFLLKHRATGKLFLIDAGFGNGRSRLIGRLAALDIAPAEISAVLITHIHPDHVGGLTLPEGGPAFPQAEILIARREYETWKADRSRASLSRHLAPCGKRIRLFDHDRAIIPGITPRCYPGHTPGHTVYEMATARGPAVFFVGDIVHAAELQVPNYRYCAKFDMDPALAADSRYKLLTRGGVWFGAHIPFPGKAEIFRTGTGERSGFGYASDDPLR